MKMKLRPTIPLHYIPEKTEKGEIFAKTILEQCDKNLVCSNVPYKCMTNDTFLVDLSKLKYLKVVVADRLGWFLNNSNFKSFFLFFKLTY